MKWLIRSTAILIASGVIATGDVRANGHEAVQDAVREVDRMGSWINRMEQRLQDWANGEEPGAQPQDRQRSGQRAGAQGGQQNRVQGGSPARDLAREENRRMQSALNGVGFDAGPADGIPGRRTRAAISAYQAHVGDPVTGQLDAAQRQRLLDDYAQIRSGAAAERFPEVSAAEGPKGLLKALRDPDYERRYATLPDPEPLPDPVPERQYAEQPDPAPLPPAAVPGVGQGGGIALPSGLDAPEPPRAVLSMAEHCELTAGITQINLGPILDGTVQNAEQALGEQFCDARAYAMTQGSGLLDKLGGNPSEYIDFCRQMATRLDPAIEEVPSGDVKRVAVTARGIMEPVFGDQMSRAATAGQICLGIGYRLDDARIALGAATMMLAAGEVPYGELMGHHARWGFGTKASEATSKSWYVTAIAALEQGADPAFWPSKTAERNSIIKGAIGMPADKIGQLSLPLLGAN